MANTSRNGDLSTRHDNYRGDGCWDDVFTAIRGELTTLLRSLS
jgi:hypothetical protein